MGHNEYRFVRVTCSENENLYADFFVEEQDWDDLGIDYVAQQIFMDSYILSAEKITCEKESELWEMLQMKVDRDFKKTWSRYYERGI